MRKFRRAAALAAALGATACAQTATQLVGSLPSGLAGPYPPESIWAPQAGGISADGRYVAFSTQQVLDPADANGKSDVYVKDLKTGACVRVSVASDGTEGNDTLTMWTSVALSPAISANGRFVVFHSSFTNLVAGDTNGRVDVFLHDRDADEDGVFDETGPGGRKTVRCSVGPAGAQGTGAQGAASANASVSDDGRHVCFASNFTDLVTGDTNGAQDVFVHDRDVNGGSLFDADTPGNVATFRISAKLDGTQAGTFLQFALNPSISGNGRHVVFQSSFADLLLPDPNGATSDVYVRDRDADHDGVFDEPGVGEQALARVNLKSDGTAPTVGEGVSSASPAQGISENGRFVVMTSSVALVPAHLGTAVNVFVRDRDGDDDGVFDEGVAGLDDTYWIDVGADAAGTGAAISPDGRFVSFRSDAANLVAGDANNATDAFTYDRTLAVMTRVSVNSVSTEQEGVTESLALTGSGLTLTDVASNGVTAFRSAANNLSAVDAPAQFDVFVNGPFPRTQGATALPQVGTNVNVSFKAPFHPGAPFVGCAAFGAFPGTFLPNGLNVPLNFDALLVYSTSTPFPAFLNYSGALDANGEATGTIAVPNDPVLVGAAFVTGFVVIDVTSPSAIGAMSNAFPMTIQP